MESKKIPPPNTVVENDKSEECLHRLTATTSDITKTLDLITAGPKVLVSPAQHLLSSALRLSVGKEATSMGGTNVSKSTDKKNIEIGHQIEELDEGEPSDEKDNNEKVTTLDSELDSNTDNDKFEENTIDGGRISRRSQLSISSRNLKGARLSISSQKLIHTLSKHSLSPIRSGVSTVSTITPKPKLSISLHKEQTRNMNEPTAEGISKSFAGFLTTASMYAGFQDIEDEDREVESLRHQNSNDSDSYLDVVSAPPENTNTLEALDTEDLINEDDMASDISTIKSNDSAGTHFKIPIPKENMIMEKTDPAFLQHSDKTGSKFELSVVKRLTCDSETRDQKDFSHNRAIAISNKLREVFDVQQTEEFISDYPCWLMGDVLLQVHIYITNHNILFFAFLPKRNKDSISKSGSLSIKSFHSLRIHRKWIILRGNTFSVYSSPTDLYFPELVIDLRTALRAETYGSSKNSDPLKPVWIKIITENRTHWFQADNLDVARAWVTILKKQIFSSRNKGDQVAIKIPLQNIIDLELTSVVGETKNLRIKVIENAETFAIDDYFVMFFSKGDRALSEIKTAIQNAGVQISNAFDTDDGDWKNSELVKSKLELLKKSSSFVKSTNFKPKPKKGKFQEFRDLILSSDDESDEDEDEDESMTNESPDALDKNNSNKNKPLSKTKKLLLPKFKTRSKTIHYVSQPNLDSSFDNLLDTTQKNDQQDNNDHKDDDYNNEKNNDEVPGHHRWSTKSLVHGITSFTQNLIFSGPALHFDEQASIAKEGQDPYFVKDKSIREASQARFVKRFSLNDSEKLLASYHLYLLKGLPNYGKLYIGSHEICFRSTIPGSSTIMILPFSDIENVNKESGFRFGYFGLVIIIRGHEELFFEFSSQEPRDDCEIQILKLLDDFKKNNTNISSLAEPQADDSAIVTSTASLNSAKIKMFENKLNDETGVNVPIIIEDHPFQKTELKPFKSYRFTLLTIGSRGDVQPYIALGKELMKEGHKVKIVTHIEFKTWVESYGIGFDVIAGDPSELMALMVSNPSINYTFIKEAKAKFREWIDDLLVTSWHACKDSDVLIESPSSIAGIHIAEKLQIPYFRAFTMPWTRTRAYPHAFMVPDQKLGGAYNYMTHVAFENGYWRGTCYQVNKWRVETLKIPKTTLGAMYQNSIPFLYNMSPVVFPPSVDFPEWVKVTGYWFLDESGEYKPPKELTDFIKKARDDGKKLVYIGFGSIVVENPKELTHSIVDAVLESDVRCIMNKGWSDRLGAKNSKIVEIDLPPEVFNSGNVPHDWLFTQIDAAVHHGGSGSTGASLRFGLPTVIKPFFGDQKFYASRVEDLGCGVALRSLDSKQLAKAIKEVTTNTRIIEKAKLVGEKIRAESGVQNAVNSIYVMMDYAKKLSVRKHKEELNEGDLMDDSNDELENEMDGSWLLV